ncbi:MAG TPA: hypothetical protein VGW96_08610 [Candidatus Eremiobacteraceae bacterium]|nr:hypothetical protein [Candidatus Eremiobacteraceae bacterium]
MIRRPVFIFVVSLIVFLVSTGFKDTQYNNHVLLAAAWLHGHIWLDGPVSGIDALPYEGHWYIIEGPLPAVLLLPFVAIFGLHTNQVAFTAVCAAIALAAAEILFERMGVETRLRNWLVAFLGFGTVVWWCTAFAAVWMLAHVIGVMFAMLILAECYGKRRPALIGFLIACMSLTRFPMILAAIPISYWLFSGSSVQGPRLDIRAVRAFALGFAPLFLLYIAYNYARWHTLGDMGYTLWYHMDQVGESTGPPFKLHYLPFNIYSFLFYPPGFVFQFPWLKPTAFGVALTFTSPALVLAFLTSPRTREGLVWWSATVLTALPSLFYYVNGFEQFGMRHSLDFTPFMMPLVARGLERCPSALSFGLIVFSIAANAYGVWYSWVYHGFTVVPR